VEVKHRRVKPVVVELKRVALEEEVHLPGLERDIRCETQVLRHCKLLLPAVADVDAEEDERHHEHEEDREAVKNLRRAVEDFWPAVGVGCLLPHVWDVLREPVDFSVNAGSRTSSTFSASSWEALPL